MAISDLAYLPPSRGTLNLLKRRLELAERGKRILEMRREILTKEMFFLLEKVKERKNIERRFIETLKNVNELRLQLGELNFRALASLSRPPGATSLNVSFQGVPCPQVKLLGPPDTSLHYDAETLKLIDELWNALAALVDVSNFEVAVRCIGEQLLRVNQVINSLERNIIPMLEDAIRRTEERVAARELEEHVRVRKLRGA